MKTWTFTVVERDAERPWLITSTHRGHVELAGDESFWNWAKVAWPPPRYSVQLDPGQEHRWPMVQTGR